jgi:MFS family permease
MFIALSHRNFRLLWIGLLVSFSGTFMQSAAVLWHVSMLVPADQRAIALGLVGLVRIFPVVLFSLISGVAADAFDRRKLMLVTQTIAAVAFHGIATVAFGLSRAFWLSFLCLAATGAADTVSATFRNLIRQLETPDRLRGRMMGVNMVFFIGGPQLGELEAGLVANWFGAITSVVTGGLGCVAATAWIAAITPALRAYRRQEPLPIPVEDDRTEGRAGEPG